jgi:Ca2+-transporting ATPase
MGLSKLTWFSNRRLDNRLNILEGITRNYFFMFINLIMVGGQVLIIFVGGDAFQIKPLNGKEWGLSVGLGAISIPWGALIRKFPDEWAAAMVPKIKIKLPKIRLFGKKKSKQQKDLDSEKGPESPSLDAEAGPFPPPKPLRTLTSIRGKRAETHIRRGFREYMHDQKVKVKAKAGKGGSKTDVSVAGGVRPVVEAA